MTCIARTIYKGKVYIGGDSLGSTSEYCISRKDAKVFKIIGEDLQSYIIGCTGSYRMTQLLMYSFVPPEMPVKTSLHKYLCTDFVNSLRNLFARGGFTEINDNVEYGGTFLIGVKDRLFIIESNFQVGESFSSFNAIGSGRNIALGSMFTSLKINPKILPKPLIFIALDAASEFNPYVRPPYTMLST